MRGSIKGSCWVITKLSHNSVVKMGVISLRRVVVVVGNGIQTVIPHVFS